jgi:hypothetical protein
LGAVHERRPGATDPVGFVAVEPNGKRRRPGVSPGNGPPRCTRIGRVAVGSGELDLVKIVLALYGSFEEIIDPVQVIIVNVGTEEHYAITLDGLIKYVDVAIAIDVGADVRPALVRRGRRGAVELRAARVGGGVRDGLVPVHSTTDVDEADVEIDQRQPEVAPVLGRCVRVVGVFLLHGAYVLKVGLARLTVHRERRDHVAPLAHRHRKRRGEARVVIRIAVLAHGLDIIRGSRHDFRPVRADLADRGPVQAERLAPRPRTCALRVLEGDTSMGREARPTPAYVRAGRVLQRATAQVAPGKETSVAGPPAI